MNHFTALKNLSPFQFTSLFFTCPVNPTLQFTILIHKSLHFTSLSFFFRLLFTSLVFTFLTLV